jgi:hypothetical protein
MSEAIVRVGHPFDNSRITDRSEVMSSLLRTAPNDCQMDFVIQLSAWNKLRLIRAR